MQCTGAVHGRRHGRSAVRSAVRQCGAPVQCTSAVRQCIAPVRCASAVRQCGAPVQCASAVRQCIAPVQCASALRQCSACFITCHSKVAHSRKVPVSKCYLDTSNFAVLSLMILLRHTVSRVPFRIKNFMGSGEGRNDHGAGGPGTPQSSPSFQLSGTGPRGATVEVSGGGPRGATAEVSGDGPRGGGLMGDGPRGGTVEVSGGGLRGATAEVSGDGPRGGGPMGATVEVSGGGPMGGTAEVSGGGRIQPPPEPTDDAPQQPSFLSELNQMMRQGRPSQMPSDIWDGPEGGGGGPWSGGNNGGHFKPWNNDHFFENGRGGRPPAPPSRYQGSKKGDKPGGSSEQGPPDPPPDSPHDDAKSDMKDHLAIILPIVALVIILAILLKTRPKWFAAGVKRVREIFSPSSSRHFTVPVDKSVYFRSHAPPNATYQAQAQLEKITVGSANVELSETVLGRGEYGLVTRGYATGLLGYPPRTVVAVKTLIRPTDPKQRACFLKEIDTMMTIGRHLNIVNLLGTVVEGNPMLILEYCANGSLKRFLKKQRPEFFYNHVQPDGSLMPFEEAEFQRKQALLNQRTDNIYGADVRQEHDSQVLSTRDLITLSYQVVRGLEYLASHAIIHRDIAARNVLVTDRTIAKLSDFGMAVQWTHDTSVTEKDFDYPMPIKWMAPESILRKTFSQKSDVWAFGILLYEMFSLGGDPYPDFTVQGQVMEFIAKIMDGTRMARPIYFPSDLHIKMSTKCFEIDPADRPTFMDIRQILEDFIPLTRQEEYLEMSQEYEAFNEMFGTMSNNAYVDLNYENINYQKY
ncbi:Vascular endothelial growth factor receptor 1 [Hypsibius exemplaris]|uniref:Vascular endothelial growth factor receptor 1 n=1 Tax=Hypsibius exemplaris TaxID=2072580 RepID=A0A9X6RN57_HYPEX|nr:Vascular endothelial growth factor receptor 1 [Hypsibius exemplaris]